MNALDLAEMIELLENQGHIYAATMLRQQQEQIEALKAEIKVLNEMLTCEGYKATREYLDYHIAEILKKDKP